MSCGSVVANGRYVKGFSVYCINLYHSVRLSVSGQERTIYKFIGNLCNYVVLTGLTDKECLSLYVKLRNSVGNNIV